MRLAFRFKHCWDREYVPLSRDIFALINQDFFRVVPEAGDEFKSLPLRESLSSCVAEQLAREEVL